MADQIIIDKEEFQALIDQLSQQNLAEQKALRQKHEQELKENNSKWLNKTNLAFAAGGLVLTIILGLSTLALSYASSLFLDANNRLHENAKMKNEMLSEDNESLSRAVKSRDSEIKQNAIAIKLISEQLKQQKEKIEYTRGVIDERKLKQVGSIKTDPKQLPKQQTKPKKRKIQNTPPPIEQYIDVPMEDGA